MTATDQIIRWSTTGAVVDVAAVAATASYEHGSPSACGTPLVRVERGLYELEQ